MAVEMNTGIICGCLPGVKPVLATLFPRLFGSSANTHTRPSYGRSHAYAQGGTHPFRSLTDKSNLTKSKTRRVEHGVSVEAIELERKVENNNYAWASAGPDLEADMPDNVIAVNQVVHIDRESKVDDASVSKGDADSEEWIFRPEPAKRP